MTATGFRLQDADFGEAKLIVGGKEFASSQMTDVSVGFIVPRAAFPSVHSNTALQSATVILLRKPDSVFSGPKEIKFQLLFTVLPESLGSFSLSTVEREERTDVGDYVSSPDLSATIIGGGRVDRRDCYVPPSGYTFDLSTAKAIETVHTAYKNDDTSPGTNFGRAELDPEQAATENRICILVWAATGCKECGGATSGRLEAKIVRKYHVDVPKDSKQMPLDWKSDAKISIPENAIEQTITVKLFGDLTKLGSPTSPPDVPFVDFDYDVRTRSVFLRPKHAWVQRD